MNSIGLREFLIVGGRQAALFLMIVLGGLVVWVVKVPVLDYGYHSGFILYAVIALALGFAVPKGFYLWGVAIVLSHPFAALLVLNFSYPELLAADVAFVYVLMSVAMATIATVFSSIGAGLRSLFDHLRHRRSAAM